MKSQIKINLQNGDKLFYLEQLTPETEINDFSCSISEYNDYLLNDALRSQNDHVALTWLLRERETNIIISYMSVITDAIKLSFSEKEIHNLNYPFKTIPAIKIAKLAVSQSSQEKYKGVGSYMIINALNIARTCNNQLCAARFLTVDADIEHDTGLLAFYEKNGFIPNSELVKKNSKTISMRRDVYQQRGCVINLRIESLPMMRYNLCKANRFFGMDNLTVNYLLTKSIETKKSPEEIIGDLVRKELAVAAGT